MFGIYVNKISRSISKNTKKLQFFSPGWCMRGASRLHHVTLPETNISPENWWLKIMKFLSRWSLFRGKLAVSFRVAVHFGCVWCVYLFGVFLGVRSLRAQLLGPSSTEFLTVQSAILGEVDTGYDSPIFLGEIGGLGGFPWCSSKFTGGKAKWKWCTQTKPI